MLEIGIALFILLHLIKSGAPVLRHWLVAVVGEDRYRGLFSLLVVGAIVLMVWGWMTSDPVAWYAPPSWTFWLSLGLMLVAFLLMGASAGSYIAHRNRHPMQSAVCLWSLAHLATVGTSKDVMLFGALGLWALGMMGLISRRSAVKVDATTPTMGVTLRNGALSLGIFVAVYAAHLGIFALTR